jgi:hypothetical protein
MADYLQYTGVPNYASHTAAERETIRSHATRTGHATRKRKHTIKEREDSEFPKIRDMIKRFRTSKNNVSSTFAVFNTVPDHQDVVNDTAIAVIENTSITAMNARPHDAFVGSLGPFAWQILDHCL